jgi:hypothetical protein
MLILQESSMISVTAKLSTAIGKETSTDKKAAIRQLFTNYKLQSKIVGDFILINDSTIEIRFIDKLSAEAFVTEAMALYESYADSIEILNIELL